MYSNTTRSEDESIKKAEADSSINDLLEIIARFDEELSEWKGETGFDTPGGCKAELENLRSKIDSLENARDNG